MRSAAQLTRTPEEWAEFQARRRARILRELLAQLALFRRAAPAHVRWIEAGYPRLTPREHRQRFGEDYKRKPRRV